MEKISTVYAREDDMTFVIKETYECGELKSTEVVGFYFGKPDDEYTEGSIGKLKAVYEL